MGKRSRKKRERRETPESAKFRQHIRFETMVEALGEKFHDYDLAALAAVSNLIDVAQDHDGQWVPFVEPIRPYTDNMEFDRAICAAGVKTFLRRTMESDQPGSGTPIDPETGEPDPTIPIPSVRYSDYMVVTELAPGLRSKRDVAISERDTLIPLLDRPGTALGAPRTIRMPPGGGIFP